MASDLRDLREYKDFVETVTPAPQGNLESLELVVKGGPQEHLAQTESMAPQAPLVRKEI